MKGSEPYSRAREGPASHSTRQDLGSHFSSEPGIYAFLYGGRESSCSRGAAGSTIHPKGARRVLGVALPAIAHIESWQRLSRQGIGLGVWIALPPRECASSLLRPAPIHNIEAGGATVPPQIAVLLGPLLTLPPLPTAPSAVQQRATKRTGPATFDTMCTSAAGGRSARQRTTPARTFAQLAAV